MNKEAFSKKLKAVMEETCKHSDCNTIELRPFICDGNPLECKIFIVGLNPASSVSWQPFWDEENSSFNKEEWFERYKIERLEKKRKQGKLNPRAVSTTRKRIGLINDELVPIKSLETNIYSFPTPSGSDLLNKDKLTLIFGFLLKSIKPRIIHIHGNDAINYFEKIIGNIQKEKLIQTDIGYGKVTIFATSHFARRQPPLTDADISQWGKILKKAVN